jgi:hypothetical protein
LFDIVVANEYLQNVSNPGAGGDHAPLTMLMARSPRFEVDRRLLAAVTDQFIFDFLTLVERIQAGTLNRRHVDEYVSAAVLRPNGSKTLRRIEPFDGASSHYRLFACAKLIAPARPSCDRSSEISVAYG